MGYIALFLLIKQFKL